MAAQNDLADFNRYAEASAQLTVSLKVVFMGDSITDNNFVGRGISGQVTSQMPLRFRQYNE